MFRAVGVADYEYNKATHIVQVKHNSLNKYRHPLHRCRNCGYSTISDEDGNCPVCGNEMESVKICSPLGFCVDYSVKPDDFNGSFDWYSPNSDIKLDCEQSLSECPQVANMTIRNNTIPSQGLVHLVNDNNGDLYNLGRNQRGIYVSRDAYPEEIGRSMQLDFESKYAFYSRVYLLYQLLKFARIYVCHPSLMKTRIVMRFAQPSCHGDIWCVRLYHPI